MCSTRLCPETDRSKQKRGSRKPIYKGEIQEKEKEDSKLRVSLSQGQRHSSISADRASREGGGKGECMMLYRVPHFSGTRLQHQGPYSSSSSDSPPDGVCTTRAIDRPLSAHPRCSSLFFFKLFLLFYKSRQQSWVIYHLWFLSHCAL